MAHGMALGLFMGAQLCGALPDVIFMTLVIGVASNQPECLYGGSLGFGPWAHAMAHGMALGVFMGAQ